jgi:GTP cyclohydrolase I
MKIEYDDTLFNDEELKNTPDRIKRFTEEWKKKQNFNFTVFDNPNYSQMVILKKIEFASLCAHHLLPFHGHADVGYIPDKKICGISKLARTVDMFSCCPQTQEKLTEEIVNFLNRKLAPKGVMVVLQAAHDCMRIRGVKKQHSIMITSAFRGVFEEQKVREEFLRLIE